MKILTPKNTPEYFDYHTYSCATCQKWVKSNIPLTENYKFCSENCFRTFVYQELLRYDKKHLLFLWNLYCYNKNKVALDITPYYSKAVLSSEKGGVIIIKT